MGTHKQKRWFIAPRNALTNESVFADLAQTCGATEDQIHRAHPCTDGKRYDVIEVAYETIAKLERSRPTYRFKFLAFRQIEGPRAWSRGHSHRRKWYGGPRTRVWLRGR